ncbi:hypothetical protein [Deinococcus misasensis]|uniref:hypothetical protein n=1 Tax=Deinococcus misasensis TaxID=392413 RepID=UPI00054F8942|nr:hypothetical protein [Deinococcus misasensis]
MTVTLPLTIAEIKEAEAQLARAKKVLSEATIIQTSCKRDLDSAKSVATITGKNPEEREKEMRFQCHREILSLQRAENEYHTARVAHEQAELHWDSIRYQLRLLEVMKGVGG